jgi:heme/copper-type cytochrome/quinol oxidase subunit 2
MELTGKKRIIVIAIAVVVVAAVIFAFIAVRRREGSPSVANSNSQSTGTAAAPISPTYLPTPVNVLVPEAGAQNVSSGIAVPQVESAASPSSNFKYRSFDIIVQGGEFTPSTIDVNQGDEVNLQIGAVGGNYDFTQPDYGIHISLPDGKSEHFEFGATAAGKFTFYCSSCGGPAKGPVGYLVVVGK